MNKNLYKNKIYIAGHRGMVGKSVTHFLKELAWRAEAIKSFFTGKESLITKETANTSMTTKIYSAEKVKQETAFYFTPIDQSIKKYCDWYIAELSS